MGFTLESNTRNSDFSNTENLYGNVLLNRISELEKQMSQKKKLISFLSQQLYQENKNYQDNQVIIDGSCIGSNHKSDYKIANGKIPLDNRNSNSRVIKEQAKIILIDDSKLNNINHGINGRGFSKY